MSKGRINLKSATALLVDSDHFTRGLIAQMLRGFGFEAPALVGTGAEAKEYIQHSHLDLCIVESALPDMMGADLIRWIRRLDPNPVRFVPIIVTTGYTQFRMITEARDAGASVIVKKPLSAQVLLDHIHWVGRTQRAFIEAGDYVGPDRRFKSIGPPNGKGRREGDPTPEQAAARAEQQPQQQKAAS